MLPSSLRTVGESAFYECSSLTGVLIPAGTRRISRSAFVKCTGLRTVVLPSSVTQMGERVFYLCDLDLNFWVEKGSYAEEWCRKNGYIETMRYMDGSLPEDRTEAE